MGNGGTGRYEELQAQAASLTVKLQEIALHLRERLGNEAEGKTARRLEKELVRVVASLDRAEQRLQRVLRRSEKGVVRAGGLLDGLADAPVAKTGKSLKKARKSLERIYR